MAELEGGDCSGYFQGVTAASPVLAHRGSVMATLLVVLCLGTSTRSLNLQPWHSSNQSNEPASIILVIDTSTSESKVDKPEIQALSEALVRLIQTSNQENEYSLISISTDPKQLVDRVSGKMAVLGGLNKLFSKPRIGATALYDACRLAVDKAQKSRYTRRLVLLISDGLDNCSSMSGKDLEGFLIKNKVPIYTVCTTNPREDVRSQQAGERVMRALAAISGGKAFHPKSAAEITLVIESIAADVVR